MDNKKEKQLIYVKDLLFRALYQWKLILVVALVFAMLLGAYAVLTNRQQVAVGGLNVTPQTQEKIDNLKLQLARYDSLIEHQKDYVLNAPYMNIDPYAVYTCGFHLCPTPVYDTPVTEATPVEQDTTIILRAYRSHVTNAATFDSLAEQFGHSAQDLRDFVSFDASTEGTLGIRVYGATLEDAQAIADALLTAATAYEEQVDRDVKAHDLMVLHFQNGPMYDMSLADYQSSVYQKLTTYENERISLKTELTRYQPTQLTAESSNPLLYAVIGAVLGAILVVGIVWMNHLGSDKIYSARVLVNRTDIRVLGCMDSGKKRFGIDRWLRKLEGRSNDRRADALSVNIRNRCQDAKSLLIMGYFRPEALTELTAALEQAGIRCHLCNDPAVKAEALEVLPQCDAVVLAETCGASRYAQVEWAMETVSDHEKKLIGCVLLDG